MRNGLKLAGLMLVAVAVSLLTGCRTIPGGIAASNTPLEGRPYMVLGATEDTDSRICLFGLIPISGSNSLRDAVAGAIRKKSGDALIDITVEGYSQFWILFSRDVTRVEGVAIRFTTPPSK